MRCSSPIPTASPRRGAARSCSATNASWRRSPARGRDPQALVDGLLAAAMEFAGGDLTDDAAVIGVALIADPDAPRD